MNEQDEDLKGENGFNSFKMILPSLPSIIIKYGSLFLKLKRDAKKAGKIFQKELLCHGIDETMATKITAKYLETSNISNYIGLFKNLKNS